MNYDSMRDKLRERITIADGNQWRFHQDSSAVRASLNNDTDEDEETSSEALSSPFRQVTCRILGPNDEPPFLSPFKDKFVTKVHQFLLQFESPLLRN